MTSTIYVPESLKNRKKQSSIQHSYVSAKHFTFSFLKIDYNDEQ